ncbi:MAG: type II secretion system F family protein [Clostridiales bacterium]|nr:type II secretion system F family protein [Clostridiales bacterium]
MKRKLLSSSYLSAFCLEVSLFLHAGIPISDGLSMLASDDNDNASKELINSLFKATEEGRLFSDAVESAGAFPPYMLEMIVLAEKTGKLEDTMRSLSAYYERQARLSASIRSAVFYPFILIAIMLVVIAVIVIEVLPIFNDVFNQMGTEMSAFALNIMAFGQALAGASTVIFVAVGILAALALLVFLVPSFRRAVAGWFKNSFGGRGLLKRISSARFAFAMAMAIESGIDSDDSITMAAKVTDGGSALTSGAEKCKQLLLGGSKLGDALTESGIFPPKNNRLLSLAQQTGTLPEVMGTIAQRSEEAIRDEIDSLISKIEPTLVILTSVIVGVILLSVMMPLMSIMSAIG